MTALTVRPTTVFASPENHTAPDPPEQRGLRRDDVRLMVASEAGIQHARFSELAEYLRAGDVLVVNTSATVPGQLDGEWWMRGAVVVHLANQLSDGTRVVELRTAPNAATPILNAHPGDVVELAAGGNVELLAPYPSAGSSPTGNGNRLWRGRVCVPGPLGDYLERHGRPISYGYLRDRYPITSYQTIFALTPGSAEMPSAARPFTPELVTRLIARGVQIAPILLHTGVSSQEAGEAPQAEWFQVPTATARLVNAAHSSGSRIIAVGTTATRAVESAADTDGWLKAASGWTELVISADHPVRVVDGLITGWHNPEASHLLLVEAIAGSQLTQRAYDAAVQERYLWHEFGDSCLLLP